MNKFADEALVTVSSGKGGNGCIAFRREKYVPRGGPAGGDGGRGGDVVFEVRRNQRTLAHLRYVQVYRARNGEDGTSRNMHGSDGADIVVPVPPGTVVFDADSGEALREFMEDGERWVFLRGGNGGWGNARFKGPVNQAPMHANPGQEGQERAIWLRLKLIADVGLAGLPNAGKSTFLAAASAARPKIADYPFTTLAPNLGTVDLSPNERFVIADIPGLIEGASEGAGLGTRFLGHVERSGCLIHLVDATQDDVAGAWRTIRHELEAYGQGLGDKTEILALNKIDALTEEARAGKAAELKAAAGVDPVMVSGVSGEGVQALLRAAWTVVRRTRGEIGPIDDDGPLQETPGGWQP